MDVGYLDFDEGHYLRMDVITYKARIYGLPTEEDIGLIYLKNEILYPQNTAYIRVYKGDKLYKEYYLTETDSNKVLIGAHCGWGTSKAKMKMYCGGAKYTLEVDG